VLTLTAVLSVLGLIVGAVAIAGTIRPGPGPAHPSPLPRSTTASPGNLVVVPDVTGQTQARATTVVQGSGLTARSTFTGSCATAGNGDVVTQDPLAGKSVRKGTSVTITICSAVPPPPTVPNVIGLSESSATASLQSQGLSVIDTMTSDCQPADRGNVVTEVPPGGAPRPKGVASPSAFATPARFRFRSRPAGRAEGVLGRAPQPVRENDFDL